MLDNFVKSKRNMFSRVSGIVIDAHKDDKINDFVRELDQNGVWLAGRREVCTMFIALIIAEFGSCFYVTTPSARATVVNDGCLMYSAHK